MLAAARLQTLVLTSDIARARAFYSGVLGLPLKGESLGALVYDVGGGDLRVSPAKSTKPSEHTVLGFAVDDLDATVADLIARGVEAERIAKFSQDERGVVIAPDGSRVLWFRDPDGNLLSVVQYAAAPAVSGIARPEELPAAFQSAWNAHDMAAFGALFHDDATFVNRFGNFTRGAEEIVALHRGIHETVYRDSALENELIAADQVAQGVAIVHFWSRLATGPAHPAGPHQIDTLILPVVTQRGGAWRIQAAENVALTDPRSGVAVLRG